MWGVVLFTVLVLGSIGASIGMHYVLVVKEKHGRFEYRRIA